MSRTQNIWLGVGTLVAFSVTFAATAWKESEWLVAIAAGIGAAALAAYTLITRHLMLTSREQSEAAWAQVELSRAQATDQAKALSAQVELAREQTRVAQESLERARRDAKRSHRATEESRLDRLAPQVYMQLTWNSTRLCIVEDPTAGFEQRSDPVALGYSRTYDEAERSPLRLFARLFLKLHNHGTQPARIDFINLANELSWSQGRPLILLPGELKILDWRRETSIATEHSSGSQSAFAVFQPEVWVRDLGMNTRDTFKTNMVLPWVHVDGSRLVLRASEPDGEPYLIPVGRRRYEVLDALEHGPHGEHEL